LHRDCIAQYVVGHLKTVASAKSEAVAAGGLSLIGSSYEGVGLNDAVLSARREVERVTKTE
jgi:oxygen-dependent protoporphyrinogen oxidase